MGCRQSSETKPTRPVDPKSIPSESQNARQDASFNELSNRDDARQNTSKTDPPLKDTHHPSSPQRQLSTKNTGRDAPAMSHNTKMEKHGSQLPKQQYEIFKNEQEVTKYRQRDGKSKITIHELDKRELIEMYNRALMVIDERSDELQTSEQQIRQLQAEIKKNTSSKQALEQLTTKHEQTVDRLNRDAAKLQQEIHELKQANDDLKNRLSAVFGAKLHDNNPDIADLSDPNRSMKLAERFSELYDNEWTNCFEVLTKQKNIVEKKAIGQMLQACLTIYQDCSTNASNDLKTLTQALDRFDGETDIRLLKNLKEKRKRRFQDDIQRLRQPIEQKIIAVFKEKTNEKNVEEFWLKCIELCWLMVIQDPPVSMDARTSQLGEIFDGTVYRHYTKSGKYVEFIVWPALRLTETGSLLYKGVAQGTDKYQQYSDSVYNDVNTDEQPSSPTSRKYQNENESCTVDEIKRSDNISKTAMGDKVLENTKGQNSGTIPKHTDKRTDEVVCRTGESEMSQNQNMFNAERAVPTQGTQDSNELHKNHNFDADVNQPVNVDPLYKNTQPNKRHSEGLSDVHNHNTSKQTETTDVEQSKQDVTQPKKKPITTSTSLAQTDYGNSTQLNASGRTSTIGENNKMSGSIHKKEKELKQSLKTKNAPSASHIGKQTMTQTVSANVQQDRKAQSVKDTSFSAIVGKHTTSIPVWPSRMNNIPVDIKQVK
ncbi:uncharacterized protein LOC127879463 [Dreissena polymorpha]|uniref:Mitochondria-eating protein C-terminal domain-containing protein n=1 Tax=Dreissena polymorpha TaxID=45954 RepID=A0A9D4QPV1_DREPO|nr:uncharacterized protein LOC127879463 [Dreissena polymorpha]XP_052282274.1 uncharacterized protein LOC127879463 [Dreissena polymorpha]KAH3838964.1 hypothetical protein DPMN_112382 [Dreissena polymorpha]